MRYLAGVAVVLGLVSVAGAAPQRPRLERKLIHFDPSTIPAIVNSRTIFLNRCKGGCKVDSAGDSDSRTNKSSIGGGMLSAFSQGDTTWNGVVQCMKQTFSRFNVDITDVDPGPFANHFEIMIAGGPGEIGLPNGVGGIAEYACSGPGNCAPFVPNALVFVFDVWGSDVNEICATAAQELAHTWSMDHVSDASDPMTYAPYSGMRNYKDGMTCGSDCDYMCGTSYCNAFQFTCSPKSGATSAAGVNGVHICMSTGTMTQNDVQMILDLFGSASATAPTLTLVNPTNFSGQPRGFTIEAQCSGPDPIAEVDFEIDGVRQATLTAAPYKYTVPTTAAGDGIHHVTAICGSTANVISVKNADVIVGAACNEGVCAAGFVCYDGACILGPDSAGGLGAPCTTSVDCKNGGTCASDGEQMACTIPCDLSASRCPDGFGCLDAGGQGVCWPGADNGGCCDTSGNGSLGSLLLGLGLAAAWITRRRAR